MPWVRVRSRHDGVWGKVAAVGYRSYIFSSVDGMALHQFALNQRNHNKSRNCEVGMRLDPEQFDCGTDV